MTRSYLMAGVAATILSSMTLVASAAPEAVQLVRSKGPAGSLAPGGHGNIRDRHRPPFAPVSADQDFWFANFDIGNSQNVSILIDTGSPDLLLNPGFYEPTNNSVSTGRNFTISFLTTNPDGSGSETVSGEVVEDKVTLLGTSLSVASQSFGNASNTDPPHTPFPHAGLMGFFAPGSTLGANVGNWFTNICAEKQIRECRFGLAFETDNTGVQYFGGVEESRFDGALSVAPIVSQWELFGDLAVNGKVITQDVEIATDSGTTIIIGPIDQAQALFDAAGIQSVLTPSSGPNNPAILTGYYPCNAPPNFGFGFPSISNASTATGPVSTKSTIFDVLPSALAQNSTGNNCTASIQGSDQFDFWLMGQALMQGKYVDHNVDAGTMGFATLKGF